VELGKEVGWKMKLQMVNLRDQYLRMKVEIDAAISQVLESTAFINGPQVEEFANALSQYLNGARVIPCANGTDALQIAMMALGLRPGDEVIVPVHTYVATAEVIALLGLKPVFVDVEEGTFNVDVQQVEKQISPRTKAIVPVHLYGQCAHLEPLQQLVSKHGIFLIEDVAQALGADYVFSNGQRRKAGTVGTIGTTSFFPSKPLGCYGDGGALITSDSTLADRIRMIANHGQRVKYYHEVIGVNSRLDTLQAAILLVKLKYLDELTQRRREVAARYHSRLARIREIRFPETASYSTHVFHQYTIVTNHRDSLKKHLEKAGVPTMIYYPVPLHLQQAFRQPGIGLGAFPIAERLSQTVLSLPIHTEMTDSEVDFIVEAIETFFK
jgi:UDP-2-acetamido-2-deoxy-ribo-hexuluronate aminotransferase